jgi:Flp pilus assembly protein CpaB
MALLAGAGVFVLGGALRGPSGPGGPAIAVVVAMRDIPFRGVLGDQDLTTAQMVQSDVPPQFYAKVTDAKGLVAQIDIKKGQAITSNMLAKTGDIIAGTQLGFLDIPSGYIARAIPNGEQQGVAGYPQAGDFLTVIATVNTSIFAKAGQVNPNVQIVSKTVFINLKILRVGPTTGQVTSAGGGSGSTTAAPAPTGVSSSLTVLMSQCDAEYMEWFVNNASMKYTLISYKDTLKDAFKTADPTCPAVASAHGVASVDVLRRYSFPPP